MNCRPGCAACCIAPSISSAIPAGAGIPGLPQGKPAGMRCPQLDGTGRCRLFGHPDRPRVCRSLTPSAEMCGNDRHHAMHWLQALEVATGAGRPATALTDECPHRANSP